MIKKLLLPLCLVLLSTAAYAQKYDEPEGGDWALGINIPTTWGDNVHLGVQPKVQFYATSRFRMEASFGYYFKAKERIDWDVLQKITNRILNEVKGVNRVLYDLSPKPVATIEWE